MRTVEGSWINSFERVLDFVFPRKCPLCGLLAERSPCQSCHDEFTISSPPLTSLTSDSTPLSYRCAIYRYEGRAAQAVRRLKYGRSTSLSACLAQEIFEFYERLGLSPDLVVPVPIHWSRKCSRGFNQADLLAHRLPNLNSSALHRVRRTRPQVGLSREQREKNIRGAFRADPGVAGKHVLLVDDVYTNGHTAKECALALQAAAAIEVGILTLCAGDR